MKRLLLVLAALAVPTVALAQPYNSRPVTEIQLYKTETARLAHNAPEGVYGYVTGTNESYIRFGASWLPLNPRNLQWSMSFDEGASKGLTLQAATGAAYSTTADAYNVFTYGSPPIKFHFVTNTTATGTITPVATAVGIDLNGGSPGDNDEWTAVWGILEGTGGPLIPGTTPAWKACATLTVEDVSGTDGCYLAVTSAGAHVDLSSNDPNYASYVAIGPVSGTINVSDSTTGPTSTTDAWADAATKALCILGTQAGVVTYTINGAAPTATDAHTLADGVPHVMRVQCINAADIANKVELSAASFTLQ
jgi:hypothetical protein